jgi:hypothetical protein
MFYAKVRRRSFHAAWVIRVTLPACPSLPVCSQLRTCLCAAITDAMCKAKAAGVSIAVSGSEQNLCWCGSRQQCRASRSVLRCICPQLASFCPAGKSPTQLECGCVKSRLKNIPLFRSKNHHYIHPHPVPLRGALGRSSRTRDGDAMDSAASGLTRDGRAGEVARESLAAG